MKTKDDIELCRNLLANIEMAQLRVANLSPEQKAWLAGARSALAWVVEYPQGGRKLDDLLKGIPLFPVVNPFEGSKLLDQMKEAK